MKATLAVGALVVGCVVSAMIGAAATRHFGTSSYSISYADFVSIMLTSISVLLAALTVFLALVAVVGWNAFNDGVRKRTEDFLQVGFREGGSLQKMLVSRVDSAMFEGVRTVNVDAQADDTLEEDGKNG